MQTVREFKSPREQYLDILKNSESIKIKASIGMCLDPDMCKEAEEYKAGNEMWHGSAQLFGQSKQQMDIILQNKVLKHATFDDYYLDTSCVMAIIAIIKTKNLKSFTINALECSEDASKLIAECAVEFYSTKIIFSGDIVRKYTNSDIKQNLMEAMTENNHLNNSFHNSWQETKLLWLASKYDENSTLHHNQTEIPAEIIHNVARQSFLNKLG